MMFNFGNFGNFGDISSLVVESLNQKSVVRKNLRTEPNADSTDSAEVADKTVFVRKSVRKNGWAEPNADSTDLAEVADQTPPELDELKNNKPTLQYKSENSKNMNQN